MARPIHSPPSSERPLVPDERLEDLGEEVGNARESLAHFLELLRLLDERGVLRLLSDLATANEEFLRVSVDWLARPESLRALQNLRILLDSLERVEPARLEKLVKEFGRAVDEATKVGPVGPRIGALGLLRQLGEPETNRGLRVLLAALKDIGSNLE